MSWRLTWNPRKGEADAAVAPATLSWEALFIPTFNGSDLGSAGTMKSISKQSLEVLKRADTGWSDVPRQTFTNIIPVK